MQCQAQEPWPGLHHLLKNVSNHWPCMCFSLKLAKMHFPTCHSTFFCAPNQIVGSTLPMFSLLWLWPTRSGKVKHISLLCPMTAPNALVPLSPNGVLHYTTKEMKNAATHGWLQHRTMPLHPLPVLPANAVPMFYLHQLSHLLDSDSNEADEYGPPLPLIHHYPSNQDKSDAVGDDDKDDDSSIPLIADKDSDEEDDDNDSSAPPNANRMHPLDSPHTNVHSQGFSHHSSSKESPWLSPDLSVQPRAHGSGYISA